MHSYVRWSHQGLGVAAVADKLPPLSSSTLSSIGARCSQLLKLAYITSLWERNLREGLKRELGEIISYR